MSTAGIPRGLRRRRFLRLKRGRSVDGAVRRHADAGRHAARRRPVRRKLRDPRRPNALQLPGLHPHLQVARPALLPGASRDHVPGPGHRGTPQQRLHRLDPEAPQMASSGTTASRSRPTTSSTRSRKAGAPSRGSTTGSTSPIIDFKGVRKLDNLTVEIPLLRSIAQFEQLTFTQASHIIQNGTNDFSRPVGRVRSSRSRSTPGARASSRRTRTTGEAHCPTSTSSSSTAAIPPIPPV